jgi:3',5'-nucleoside bisphosphate phosphatase
MMSLAADLHIHTVLSPCASRAMRPAAIAREARDRGLSLIAVCDHNSARNAAAVATAAAALEDGPVVIAGMEITTAEEVHVLGLFPDARRAAAAEAEVIAGLPPWRPFARRPEAEPEQEVVDAAGAVLSIEHAMLAAASRFPLAEAVGLVHRHGGLAVAAHVDRRSFSVPGQLGFFPPEVVFDGIEISAAGASRGAAAQFASVGAPLLCSSDAHFLEDIGTGMTLLDVEAPGFEELALALAGHGSRRCVVA